ncbi:MAG: hypothetical protein OEZ16_01550 [Chromatiales bacterium]|nr:hypothetical protein [Chromatiales bacterium]
MKIWPILLGSWFILYGLTTLIKLSFRYDDVIMASLALVTGIFIIIRR